MNFFSKSWYLKDEAGHFTCKFNNRRHYAMENPSDNSHSDHHDPYKRERKIVDDPLSGYPTLLRWLRRNLKLMRPINNSNYYQNSIA